MTFPIRRGAQQLLQGVVNQAIKSNSSIADAAAKSVSKPATFGKAQSNLLSIKQLMEGGEQLSRGTVGKSQPNKFVSIKELIGNEPLHQTTKPISNTLAQGIRQTSPMETKALQKLETQAAKLERLEVQTEKLSRTLDEVLGKIEELGINIKELGPIISESNPSRTDALKKLLNEAATKNGWSASQTAEKSEAAHKLIDKLQAGINTAAAAVGIGAATGLGVATYKATYDEAFMDKVKGAANDMGLNLEKHNWDDAEPLIGSLTTIVAFYALAKSYARGAGIKPAEKALNSLATQVYSKMMKVPPNKAETMIKLGKESAGLADVARSQKPGTHFRS
ncbi:hypothetical protein [Agarilytica rhodophyticola]|uniref:hypothetical protein n=1 Tax=Agarilytica rhodophyticola TaxID=1737490 RepID=UPI000B34157F|nr:hypothetical protein [Agarilytica rhodophyticola]